MRILWLPFFIASLCSTGVGQTTAGWQLAWSDEFNGPAGTPPDPAKWNYDLGRGNPVGWGNGELENYTNSPQNAFQDGSGHLIIRVIRDAAGNYTSARLQTGSPGASTHTTNGNWQYGRILARMKLPYAQGVWPAFWMLGENIATAGWPGCGEIDIMENFGAQKNDAAVNRGTAHGPGYSGGQGITKVFPMPFGEKVANDFHVYAIEWSPDTIQWSVDGEVYHKVTPASLPNNAKWVFNAPFFILLNVAIGGPGQNSPSGTPDPNAPFPPQDLLVDYVRVYQSVPVADATPVITPGTVVNAASFLGALAPGSLATLYGTNLAGDGSADGVSVSVNGITAPLIYVSPAQINFQVPWQTVPGPAVDVKVVRNGVESTPETVEIDAAAPAAFLSEFTNGTVWVNGAGCATTECAVQPGGSYVLWGNGFGAKNGPSHDGVPADASGGLAPLQVPGGCQLAIGGQQATVQYCGAAPAEVIDQLNFVYPAGVTASTPYVDAALTIGGTTGHFRVPAPAAQ